MNQNRNYWLDIAKGIAIILMVAGHTSIPGVVSHFIYAFHMPLFFIASGLVSNYEKDSLVDYIKHKSYTLLLPFVCYSAIVSFLMYSIEELDVIQLLKRGWGGICIMVYPCFIYDISFGTDNFLSKEEICPTLYYVMFLFNRIQFAAL